MKKLAIIIAAVFALSSFSAFAKSHSEPTDYIVTEGQIVYVHNVYNGLNNKLIAKSEQGEKIKLNKEDVIGYRNNGKEYRKMMFVESGANHVSYEFLEKMYTRAGYTIYKKPGISVYDLKLSDMYVFDGDQFELQLNEENHEVVLSFFFSKFNEIFKS